MAKLYVGDLHADVTERDLHDAFSEYQGFDSVRVCRDSSTGRSLGDGYVKFYHHDYAERAIEVKNHSTLKGKAIRVSWPRRDSDVRRSKPAYVTSLTKKRSKPAYVFIKNLNDTIDSTELEEMFQKFGNILSCKVAVSEDGRSKGSGSVQFETEDSANAAIEELNGSEVGGKQRYVGKPSPDKIYTNLFIKNLDVDISEEHLREKCSEFGKIISLGIPKDKNGGSKGSGYVNFENPDDARRAVEAMNGSKFGCKILHVARAQKKTERKGVTRYVGKPSPDKIYTNLFIKNLDVDISEEHLRGKCSEFGKIISLGIPKDKNGGSKGSGYVNFENPDDARRAVEAMNGSKLGCKILHVARAQKKTERKGIIRKEDRQAQLQLNHAQGFAGPTGSSA